MRTAAVLIVLALTASARADDDAPVTGPMAKLADRDGACPALRQDLDAKLACKSVAHVALAGGATAELYAVTGDVIRYAVVITDGATHAASAPLEVVRSDCGMMKCDLLDAQTPRLRVVRHGALAVLELTARYHHEVHEPRQAITARWQTVDYVACGKNDAGELACVTRHLGGPDDSCKARLSDDGELRVTCESSETLGL